MTEEAKTVIINLGNVCVFLRAVMESFPSLKELAEYKVLSCNKAIDLIKEREEQLDELMSPKKYVVCKACGHKLRNDWLWCPWCRWEIRSGYDSEELE